MIKEKGFSGNAVTQKETFESFYTRKLEAIRIQLKDIIKGDTPYVTSAEYSCKICSGRIKLHSQGKIYCLMCAMPPAWSKDLKRSVFQILQGYPSLEESAKGWEASQVSRALPGKPAPKTGSEELGARIQEAREKSGMTYESLAYRIYKKDGFNISTKSIKGYEKGYTYPPKYILEQINKILGMNE